MTDWGEAAFYPRSVAIVGASANDKKLGYLLVRNLLAGYPGRIYPINPTESSIMGLTAYARLQDVPDEIDLAALAVPPAACLEAIADCVAAGVKVALILTAGFAEAGSTGATLQRAVVERARAGSVRVIGPNSFGLYNCNLGLNVSMGLGLPPPGGTISLVTQSGAYGMAICSLARERDLRFAKVLSTGNKADLHDHEILEYFARDDETQVLCLFLESVSDGRKFYEALCALTRRKHVVIARTGRSSAGQRAAASHTAALSGSVTAFVTAVQQAGALLAESGLEMLELAEGLSRQPLPPGRRVGIITNSGGTGVELADLCERAGLSVPELPAPSQEQIARLLPPYASPRNPVDVTPAWSRFPTMYAGSIEALYHCQEIDLLIPILLQRSALMRENVEAVRDTVLRCQKERGLAKPTYVCWVAGREAHEQRALLQQAGIPVYDWPERAASVASALAAYANRRRERETWQRDPSPLPPGLQSQIAPVIAAARAQRRELLLEEEVKAIMAALGARVPRSVLCRSAAQAREAARRLGKPCVMKIVSPVVSHKSEVGGVRVGVSPTEAAAVFDELVAGVRQRLPQTQILGVSVQELITGQETFIGGLRDPSFGPMVLFGLGGVFIEVLHDISYRLVPARPEEFQAMIREVRSYPLLAGIRGQSRADLGALIQVLQAVSWLLELFPEIRELDLNPVIAGPQGAVVADGRAFLDLDSAAALTN